jgi:preprotein translocase subunit Sec63
MNITFDYILDNVKGDLQGYSNSRKWIKAEEKLTVALRYVFVIVVWIKINYICKMLTAIKIQCNLTGNYTRK